MPVAVLFSFDAYVFLHKQRRKDDCSAKLHNRLTVGTNCPKTSEEGKDKYYPHRISQTEKKSILITHLARSQNGALSVPGCPTSPPGYPGTSLLAVKELSQEA